MLLALLERGIGDAAREAAQVGRAADDEHALGRLPATLEGGAPIAVVGGDDDVGHPVGQALERDHAAIQQVLAAAEARQVELGHEVVLVEDHPGAAQLQRQRDEEQQVGRVADVDDVEPAEAASEAPGAPERRRVLAQVPGRTRRSPRSSG